MAGLIEPSPLSEQEEGSIWVPIGLGVAFVVIVVGIVAWFSRSQPKVAPPPPAYAANLKLSDLKMSTAQNFVGSTVTYVEGTVTNSGSQTVTHVVVHVIFNDSMNQVTQLEDIPLHVLDNSGPYPDARGPQRGSPLAAWPKQTISPHLRTRERELEPGLSQSAESRKLSRNRTPRICEDSTDHSESLFIRVIGGAFLRRMFA